MAKSPEVSRSNPRLSEQARKLRICLRAALRHTTQAKLSEDYAEAIINGHAQGPPLAPERISRMLSEKECAHTEPWALWRLSEAGFHSETLVPHALILYDIGGWLTAFVQTVATADFSKIGGAGSLRKMLEWLTDEGKNPTAERVWALTSKQREAFLPPKEAAEQFQRRQADLDDRHGNLKLAAMLATTYNLPYEYRRRLVIEHLMKWLTIVQERPEKFTLR